jgi:hypothetical protein
MTAVPERTLVGADGQTLRQYDDITLLHAIPATSKGNVDVEMIEAGTRATIISIFEREDLADLECYVSPSSFAFGTGVPSNMRLAQRREEKLKNA